MLLSSKKILCFLLLTTTLLLTCCTLKSEFDDDLSNDVFEDDENGEFENNDNDSLHNSSELPGEGVEDDEKIYPINPDDTMKPSEPETPSEPESPDTPTNPAYPDGVAVFDDLAVGTRVGTTRLTTNGIIFSFDERCSAEVSVVESPFGEENALKYLKSDTQNGASVIFHNASALRKRTVVEFDMMIDHTNVSVPLQINIGTSYRLQISTSLGYMYVNDATQDGKTVNYLGGQCALGEKIHIRVEFYFGNGTQDTSYAKVYFDGELSAISQNTYYAEPRNTGLTVKFYSLKSSNATLYLDNVSVSTDNVTFVDDGGADVKRFFVGNMGGNSQESMNEDIIGADGVAALKDLASIFDERVYIWLANLYDPETGGFYYSNDARDYLGFYPDAESTAQAMSLIQAIGLGKAQDYYTDEMAAKVVAWVQSLQAEDDGYFYHPQWGKDIPMGRRSRDYSWCTSILNRFGAEPLYTLALDRLSGTSPVALVKPLSEARSAVIAVAAIPENNSHVSSPEALIAYLDELYRVNSTFDKDGNFVDLNSYNFCAEVGAVVSEAKAAGLSDVLIDYLNEKQFPENGLWEKTACYRAASGILKISGVYNKLGEPFPYADKLCESMIEIIKSEEPLTQSVYVYNPVAGLANVLTNLNNYAVGAESIELRIKVIETMRESALSIIENTKRKIQCFKRDDGSFSYSATGAPAVSAGVTVCFGRLEGDINGCGLVNSTITNLYTCFGMTRPAMFGEEDKEVFREIIQNKTPVEKQVVYGGTVDFEGSDKLPPNVAIGMNSSGSYSLVTENGNTSLEVKTEAGNGDNVKFVAGAAGGEGSCYVFEADVTYVKSNNTTVSQIFFTSKSSFALNINYSNGKIRIWEHKQSGTRDTLIDGVPADGVPIHFEIRYYPMERYAEIKLISCGVEYTATTTALFNPDCADEPLDTVRFYMLNSAVVTVRLDNVEVYTVK